MTDRLCKASVVGVLALAAAGCGSSSPHSATTAPTSQSASIPAITSQPTTTVAPPVTTTTAPKTTTATTTPATTSTASAPPPPPADGLRPTGGYQTYENCSANCSGAVPASLRRALRLPTGSSGSCPVSAGSGPIRPLGGASPLRVTPFVGSAWLGARVTWASSATYTGPVLIRGRQLGGPYAVGFGEGHVPYDELQLLAPGMGASPAPGGGREWQSFTRVRAPGCYGYQVDGTSFSEVIVFKAAS